MKINSNPHDQQFGLTVAAVLSVAMASSAFCQSLHAQSVDPVQISVDSRQTGEPLNPVWSYFGYDECNVTTSEEGKALLRELAAVSQKPPYIRMHFLFCSGDGKTDLKWGSTNVYTEDDNGKPVYSWDILDEIVDAIVEAGCRHHFQFGFMPQSLAPSDKPYKKSEGLGKHGRNTGVSSPPVDYEKWAELVRTVTQRYAQRYPKESLTWNWQLWNEPNIGFFAGSKQEFFKLTDYTERAFRDAFPKGRYGGPHTAGGNKGNFLGKFLEHCESGTNHVTGETGTPLDFVAFHAKGRTSMVNGHVQVNFQYNLSVIEDGFDAISKNKTFARRPVIIGECDPEGTAAMSARVKPANGYRHGSIFAAYEVAIMKHAMDLAKTKDINLEGVLTWSFLFKNKDYFEGYRCLSTNGIKKPVFNAFAMLGRLKGNRVDLHSSGALGVKGILEKGTADAADIDGMAFRSDGLTQVILWNYHDVMVEHSGRPIALGVKAPSDEIKRASVTHYRIDKNHSNAYTHWLEMGSPQKLTPDQERVLKQRGELEQLTPAETLDVHKGNLELNFDLPRNAVSFIEINWLQG